MLAQICQFFAIDSSNFPTNEHILIGDRSCQGGFLIHFFLNLCQKQNRPVLFVGLSQTFSHYNTVSQKLGINLVGAKNENKNLIYIDGLQLLSECIDSGKSEHNPYFHLLKGDSAPLLELIRSSLETLTVTQTKLKAAQPELSEISAPVVIIDDLSILQSTGVSPGDIILLVNRINELLTSTTINGSLISLFHLDEDEKSEEIWSFLSHLSTLKIEVSDLQSGYCRDIHGQIHAQWRDTQVKPRKSVTRHTQFKLSDKNIELFAPGMSSAVL